MGGVHGIKAQMQHWRSDSVQPAAVTDLARQTAQLLLLLSKQLAALLYVPPPVKKQLPLLGRFPPGAANRRREATLQTPGSASARSVSSAATLLTPALVDSQQQASVGFAKWTPMKQQIMALVSTSLSLRTQLPIVNYDRSSQGVANTSLAAGGSSSSTAVGSMGAGLTQGQAPDMSQGMLNLRHKLSELSCTVPAQPDAEGRAVAVALAGRLLPTAYAFFLTMQVNNARMQKGMSKSKQQLFHDGVALAAAQGACAALLEVAVSAYSVTPTEGNYLGGVTLTTQQQAADLHPAKGRDAAAARVVSACKDMGTAKLMIDAARGLHDYSKAMHGSQSSDHLKLVCLAP